MCCDKKIIIFLKKKIVVFIINLKLKDISTGCAALKIISKTPRLDIREMRIKNLVSSTFSYFFTIFSICIFLERNVPAGDST